MKKLKMLATLGTFLMAFFVLGLQSASAQIQGPTEAYQTLKLAAKSLSPMTLEGAEGATANYGATKGFIERTLGNLDSEATTQEAIDATYDDLVAISGGDATRIAKLDEAKLYVEDLLQ